MARFALVSVLLASGCLVSHVEGDPSLDPGEAFVCEARVACAGEDVALVRDQLCAPMFDPEAALTEFTAALGAACEVSDVWCIGAGDRSVGGTGVVEVCLR